MVQGGVHIVWLVHVSARTLKLSSSSKSNNWDPPFYLPNNVQLLLCLSRTDAFKDSGLQNLKASFSFMQELFLFAGGCMQLCMDEKIAN